MPRHPDPDLAAASPRRRWGRWLRRSFLALALAAAAGWGGPNLFLATGLGERLLSRRPERLQVSWEEGWSPYPGKVHLAGLRIAGRSPRFRWEIRLAEAQGLVSLPALAARRFEAAGLRGRGLEVSFLRQPEEPPPSRPPRPPWTIELRDFAVEEVRELTAGDYRLSGGETATGGRGSGSFRYQIRGPVELGDIRLTLPASRLTIAGETAAELADLDLALSSEPFVPREHPGPAALAFFRGEARLRGEVASLDFLDYYLSRVPRLAVAGSGTLQAEISLAAGRLLPTSELHVDSPAITARFLDYAAAGKATLDLVVEEEAGGAHGRLELAFDDFAVRREGAASPHVRGTGLRLAGASRDLTLSQPFSDLAVTVELPSSEIPDLTVYNLYLPPRVPLAFRSGSGEISGRLELSAADSGRGELRLRARRATAQVGKGRLRGDLELVTRLLSQSLRQRRFELSGSRLRLDRVEALSADGRRVPDTPLWWAELELAEGEMTWGQPLALDAHLDARLRDSRPLLAFFTGDGPVARRFNSLLDIEDIRARAHLAVDSREVTLERLEAASGDLTLLARLRLGGGRQQGLVYAHYKHLDAGLELRGEERTLKLRRAREWFDSHPDWP